jgi:hypothetical protein
MYRLGSSQYDALRTISSQGKDFYRALTAKRTEVGELRAVALRNYEHPFHFRPDTSDAHLVIQTLVRQEYGNLPRGLKAGFIIDAGANIGDSAVYFLNRFRGCRLVALEPHPVFSSIAKRNLACYPRYAHSKGSLESRNQAGTFGSGNRFFVLRRHQPLV